MGRNVEQSRMGVGVGGISWMDRNRNVYIKGSLEVVDIRG